MYSASATFLTKIKSNTRKISWSGTITTVGGSTYSLDLENIVSGTITRSISSQSLNIGTAYASTISMELILAGVSRYELYNGIITISCSVDGATDVIPMGSFIISEANQTSDHISIKGYDNMVKFDAVNFAPSLHTSIQSPYAWISEACTQCGVTLGVSSATIRAMANGTRNTGFADVVTDAKSWRDVLCYITAYLGGYAYIGRDGYLYISSYGSVSSDTVPANFRYSSKLSDYQTTYDGLYAICKAEGTQEYVSNTNTGGLVLDLGTNPFLQFIDNANRIQALQEIIDTWDGVYYVPFSSEMPLIPIYDPGDILTFTGNQADVYDFGAITEITYNVNGTMSVTCGGDNPRLAEAQDRFSKTVEGLSNEYSNGQEIGGKNFWMLISDNTSDVVATSTKTQVAEIEWNQTTDIQKIGMMYTCEALVSATATVELELSVDDEANYKFITKEEKLMLGKRIITATCGFKISDKGDHVAKVYMTVTDSPLLWGDLA